MTPLLVCDTEIRTSPPPFSSVRLNAAAARARLGEEMGQLVPEGAIDFRLAVLPKPQVQRDQRFSGIGAPGGGAEPRIPFYPQERAKLASACSRQHSSPALFKSNVPAANCRESC